MLCSHIRMILLLVHITQITGVVSAKNACEDKICNYEAKCELKNGEPYCQCIGDNYFTGKFCMEQVNNCLPNPCQNGAPCTNALGQPICGPCVAGFGGHLCDVAKADTFTKMYLHHNRYGYLAVDEHFLFTLESLGSAAFLLEFHADSYAIDAFKTEPRNPIRWHKSSDLARVARENGLHHTDRLPYQSGYYHITKARFWVDGLQKLRIKVTDVGSLQSYVEKTYNMQILPKDKSCRPEIELLHCADPFKPLMLDVGRYNTIQVIVHKRCWKGSNMEFSWEVFNNIETVLLHSYGQTSMPRFKVSPYPAWAAHIGELMQSFLIRIGIKESVGSRETYIVSRCYVFVITKPVIAKIIGGPKREVDVRALIVLDGSPSRDFAISPILKSQLFYNWRCESIDDPENKNCAKDMGKDKVFTIPMGRLRKGMTYKFILEVRSKINAFSRDEATQIITLVETNPLYVNIECIRNCEAQKFVPDELLHLRALCLNCEYEWTLKYTWKVNGNQVADTKRLIIKKANNEASLTAEVELAYNSRQGRATIELNRNMAPTGGDCKVTPVSGEELKTEFLISCNNFQDEDQSLSYEFTAETFALDRSTDPSTKVRLPKGNIITVTICDSLRACATKSLDVNVKEIDANSGLVPFLNNYDSTINQLFKNGDIEQAMLVALAATRLIVSTDDAKNLGLQLQQCTLQTLLDIEQFLQVISSIFKKVTPLKSEGADVLYKMLAKLATGFEHVLGDGEVQELLLQAYVKTQSELTSFLEALTNPTEIINEVQTFEPLQVHTYNRIDESSNIIDISDTGILPRLNSWVKYSSSLDSCLKLIGLMASHVHEPKEPNTITIESELRFDTFSFEQKTSQTLTTADGVAEISVDTGLVFNLQMLLQSSNVLLQIISTPKNPFWWFPGKNNINTGVLYFSGFSSKIKYKHFKDIQLRDVFELTLKLNVLPNSKENTEMYMLGRLTSNEDMNIFEIHLPTNSLLLVYFISTTIDLRVLIELNCKPSGFRTHKSNIYIRTTGDNKPLLLLNKEGIDFNAYLSVVPAQNFGHDPAEFVFVSEIRQCLTWDFNLRTPKWTTEGCWPKEEESLADGLHCYCEHMSAYAGKVFNIPSYSLYKVGNLRERLPINWYMLCSQIAFGFICICWAFLAYLFLHPNREHLVVAPKNRNNFLSSIFNGEILIRFTTGGYRNASTTAGIIIIMNTVNGPLKFKIYQNPIDPHLKQHSTCTVRLPLNPEMLIRPFTLYLRHDGGGRYPTWYCRNIEVDFLKGEKPIHLSVDSWVDEIGLQLSEASEPRIRKHEKWKQFTTRLETICTNWFFYNPLFGPWKYGNRTFNRFERTLIWILKIAITVLVVTSVFGWTTLRNYEQEREKYRYLSIDVLNLSIISLLTFFVGSILQFGIEYWVFKSNQEAYERAV